MPINARTAAGTNRRPPTLEVGGYPTRVVLVVDLGIQTQRPYLGGGKPEPKPPTREISLTYEFIDEFLLDDDGNELIDKPRWLTESFPLYNLEADKAKSTKRYMALDPKLKHDGDFMQMIDTPCTVTIVHSPNKKTPDKPWENVGGVTAMRAKDVQLVGELVNKPVAFDLEEPNLESYLALPKWIQKRICENLEFEGSLLKRMLEEGEKGVPQAAVAGGVDEPNQEEEKPY